MNKLKKILAALILIAFALMICFSLFILSSAAMTGDILAKIILALLGTIIALLLLCLAVSWAAEVLFGK